MYFHHAAATPALFLHPLLYVLLNLLLGAGTPGPLCEPHLCTFLILLRVAATIGPFLHRIICVLLNMLLGAGTPAPVFEPRLLCLKCVHIVFLASSKGLYVSVYSYAFLWLFTDFA